MNHAGIALFINYPEPGQGKKHLAAVLGDETAAELDRCFVLDLLDKLDRAPAKLLVFYDPEIQPDMKKILLDRLQKDQELVPQNGPDLGARMEIAFQHSFTQRLERVALISCNVPDYPASLVNHALEELKHRDVVFGPAMDGGCYLLGFRKEAFHPEVFRSVPWGTDQALNIFMDQLQAKGLSSLRLPEWIDVDTIRDLNSLWRLNRNTSFNRYRTYQMLEKLQNILERYDREPVESLDGQGKPQDESKQAKL